MGLARLYTFVPATVIQSAQVNAEFNQLVEALNGTSTDKDITLKLSHATNAPLTLNQTSTGPILLIKKAGTEKARFDNNGTLKLGNSQPDGGGGLNHLLSNLSATIVGEASEDDPHVFEGAAAERAMTLLQPAANTPAFLACYKRSDSSPYYNLLPYVFRTRAGGTGANNTTQLMRIDGVMQATFADIGNVGAGEDDLYTKTLPGYVWANSAADFVEGTAAGRTAGNGANKQIKLYVGGTQVFATGVQTWNDKDWLMKFYIVQYDTDKLRCVTQFIVEGGTFVEVNNATVTGLTLSGNIIVKVTGEATSNDDIVQDTWILKKGTGN